MPTATPRPHRPSHRRQAAALVLLTALGILLLGARPAAALPETGELARQPALHQGEAPDRAGRRVVAQDHDGISLSAFRIPAAVACAAAGTVLLGVWLLALDTAASRWRRTRVPDQHAHQLRSPGAPTSPVHPAPAGQRPASPGPNPARPLPLPPTTWSPARPQRTHVQARARATAPAATRPRRPAPPDRICTASVRPSLKR